MRQSKNSIVIHDTMLSSASCYVLAVLCQLDTSYKITSEDGTSAEKMPSYDKAEGKPVRHFLNL